MFVISCKENDLNIVPVPSPVAPTNVESGSELERVTIRMALYDSEFDEYEPLIKAFEVENPQIHIELVSVNQILNIPNTGINVQFSENTDQLIAQNADVFNSQFINSETLQQGLIKDLTPFIEIDEQFDKNDFYPHTLGEENSPVAILPTSISYSIFYFNKTIFDEQGIPYPKFDWTQDEFIALAIRLTESKSNGEAQWGFVQSSFNPLLLVNNYLGSSSSNSSATDISDYTDQTIIEAIDWYTQLHTDYAAIPPLEPIAEPNTSISNLTPDTLIVNDEIAMWTGNSDRLNIYKDQLNIGVLPYPNSSARATSFSVPMFRDGLVMSAGTNTPNEAWEWISYISNQPPLSDSFTLPARSSVAATMGVWTDMPPELQELLPQIIDNAIPFRASRNSQQTIRDAVLAIIKDGVSVESALTNVVSPSNAEATIEPFTIEQDLQNESDIITITYTPFSTNLETHRLLAEQFEFENSDFHIEILPPNVSQAGFELSDIAREADCFQWFPDIYTTDSRTAILDLAPFIQADIGFDLEDFYPSLTAQFMHQGQLWALPAEIQPYIIEYNKALFDDVSATYPSNDWTTATFLDVVTALTIDDGEMKQYGFISENVEGVSLLIMLERLGANLIDDTADFPNLALATPETVEAMQWYANLTAEYGVKPVFLTDLAGRDTYDYEVRANMLNEHRVAMWMTSGAGDQSFIRDDVSIGVVALPKGSESAGNGLRPALGYYISSRTESAGACWEWIDFLTNSFNSGYGLPARQSVAESTAYQQWVGMERASAYLASIEGSSESAVFRFFTSEDWLGNGVLWLSRAYGQIATAEFTAEQALENAQVFFDAYRACVIENDAFFSQEMRNTCAVQTDPTLVGIFGSQ